MTDLRAILTNVWRLRRRYTMVVIVLVAGSLLVSAGLTLGNYAADTTSNAESSGSVLRRITVYGGQSGKPLNADTLASIESTTGIESVEPVLQVPVGLEHDRSVVTLTNLRSTQRLPRVAGVVVAGGGTKAVLPSTIDGKPTSALVGKTVKIAFTQAVTSSSGTQKAGSLLAVGTYDSSWQLDGVNAVYCSLECVIGFAAQRAGVPADQFAQLVGWDKAEVYARTVQDVETVTVALQSQGLHAVSVQQELAEVPGVISLIRLVTGVFFVFLLVLGAVTAVAISQALARQRTTEAAILTTVGWPPARIMRVLLGEVVLVASAAAAAGVALGVATGLISSASLSSRPHYAGLLGTAGAPPVALLLLTVVAAVVAVVVGAAGSLRRVSRTDVVSTLRAL
jgi:putative ABC transport system permease protein